MQNLKTLLQSNIFLIIFTFLAIFLSALAFIIPHKSKYNFNVTKINGKIISFKIDGNMLKIEVQALEKITAFYYFTSLEEKENIINKIGYGKEIYLEGKLSVPDSADIPHTFDYQKYLYFKNIYFIMNAEKIEIGNCKNIFSNIKTKIYRHLLNLPNSDFLLAFLLGNSSNLELEQIRNNGISHLFAVSGMHISLFALVLRNIFKKLGNKKDILISIFLIFYAFLVGLTPSVLRSCLLFILIAINNLTNLKISNKRLLYYLFLALICFNPFYIMDMGFQYSFSICFALLFVKSSKNYWLNLLKTSFIAFLVSLPISAINFYQINALSIIWNLFFVPFVTFILYPFCFIVVIFPFLTFIFTLILNIFNFVNNFCNNIKIGIIVLPFVYPFFWLLYYLILIMFIKNNKYKTFILLLLFISFLKILPKLNSNAFVYFLDVGQGDAAIFISPYQNEVIMIDTGGIKSYNDETWQVRKNKILQSETIKTFLFSLGIKKIDLLLLTHGDYDHAGNALSLLEKIEIKNIMINKNSLNELEKNIVYSYNDKIVSFYNPTFFKWQLKYFNEENENNASIITRIKVFSKTFLMMGDVTKKEELKLLNDNIVSDVIKIGHHGSNTSSEKTFLAKVKPNYAIISVGKNNHYNHPSEETINNLKFLNIDYFLTKDSKTIWFKINKKNLKLYTLN